MSKDAEPKPNETKVTIPPAMQLGIQKKFENSKTKPVNLPNPEVPDPDPNKPDPNKEKEDKEFISSLDVNVQLTEESYKRLKSIGELNPEIQKKVEEYEASNLSEEEKKKLEEQKQKEANSGITDQQVLDKVKELQEKESKGETLSDVEKNFLNDFKDFNPEEQPTNTEDNKGFKEYTEYYKSHGIDVGDGITSIEDRKKADKELGKKLATDHLTNILNNTPHFRDFYDHVSKGGTIHTFKTEVDVKDFSKLEIKPLDSLQSDERDKVIENAKTIIKEDLRRKGVIDITHEAVIKSLEDKGDKDFIEYAQKVHKAIVDEDNSIIQKAQNDSKVKQQQEEEKNRQYLESINNNNFGDNIKLPEEAVESFKLAATTSDNEGRTTIDKKWNELTPSQYALLDYIVHSDFSMFKQDTTTVTKPNEVNRSDYSALFSGGMSTKKGTLTLNKVRDQLSGKNYGALFTKDTK